jgi:UDP-glucuronate decarboxylase
LSTGRLQNIEDLLDNENFEFIQHDVTEEYHYPCDEIYNLACPASPPKYQADPIETSRISFLGALNALALARKYNAKVMQASTSEVYGDPKVSLQNEDYWGNVNCTGIRSCYDEGKRIAESLFFDHNRQYGTKIKVVRIFNTYGPLMDPKDGRVVSNFINQALSGDDVTLYGGGVQTRSFCYVDDLIDGFVRMMNTDNNILGPINIGNPNEFKVYELAELVLSKVGSSSKKIDLPMPSDDPQQRRPDISRAKELLGWSPKIQLDEGLDLTINYFKKLGDKK